MAVAVQLEASFDDATFERFKEECAQPGLAASRWSQVVANALSTVVSSSARTASTDEPKFCPTVCK